MRNISTLWLTLNTTCWCIQKTWNYFMQGGSYASVLYRNAISPRSCQMDWKTVGTCSVVRRVHVSARQVLHSKDKKDHSNWLHQCSHHGWIVYVWKYHEYRGMYWGFRETYAGIKANVTLFQQDRPPSACVKTAWLGRHRVHVLD